MAMEMLNIWVLMAFDIVGINPKRAHSKCLRFNIWKWNDLRIILKHFRIFDVIDEPKFMSNDSYCVTGNNFNKIKDALNYIKLVSEIDNENPNWFFHKIYSHKANADFVSYHGDCPGFNGGQFGHSDLIIFILFLSDCEGFEIR